MKKAHLLLLSLLLAFCVSTKKPAVELGDYTIENQCPDGCNCTFEVLKDKPS